MKISKYGFSFVELVITLTIIATVSSFAFTKMWNFVAKEATWTSIDSIERDILDFRVSSLVKKSNDKIYFVKDFDKYYYIYSDMFFKANDFYISSWSYIDQDYLDLSLQSLTLKDFTWSVFLDNELISEVYFNASWTWSSNIHLDYEYLVNNRDHSIYIKNDAWIIITWSIKIVQNSINDRVSIFSIRWSKFDDYETKLDVLKILNNWKGKNILYWLINWDFIRLKKVDISFIDKDWYGANIILN